MALNFIGEDETIFSKTPEDNEYVITKGDRKLFMAQVYKIESTIDTNVYSNAFAGAGSSRACNIYVPMDGDHWKKISEENENVFIHSIKLDCDIKNGTTGAMAIMMNDYADPNGEEWQSIDYTETEYVSISLRANLNSEYGTETNGLNASTGIYLVNRAAGADTKYVKNLKITIYYSSNITERKKPLPQSDVFAVF